MKIYFMPCNYIFVLLHEIAFPSIISNRNVLLPKKHILLDCLYFSLCIFRYLFMPL